MTVLAYSPGTALGVYDPVTRQWASLPSMTAPRYRATAGGKRTPVCHVGLQRNNPFAAVEVYNPATRGRRWPVAPAA